MWAYWAWARIHWVMKKAFSCRGPCKRKPFYFFVPRFYPDLRATTYLNSTSGRPPCHGAQPWGVPVTETLNPSCVGT